MKRGVVAQKCLMRWWARFGKIDLGLGLRALFECLSVVAFGTVAPSRIQNSESPVEMHCTSNPHCKSRNPAAGVGLVRSQLEIVVLQAMQPEKMILLPGSTLCMRQLQQLPRLCCLMKKLMVVEDEIYQRKTRKTADSAQHRCQISSLALGNVLHLAFFGDYCPPCQASWVGARSAPSRGRKAVC